MDSVFSGIYNGFSQNNEDGNNTGTIHPYRPWKPSRFNIVGPNDFDIRKEAIVLLHDVTTIPPAPPPLPETKFSHAEYDKGKFIKELEAKVRGLLSSNSTEDAR